MIPICTAQTHSDCVSPKRRFSGGFTFTELVVVLLMLSLFALLAQMNLFGLLRKSTFKAQVQDFVSTMHLAVNAAAESNKRYEVIIDLTEQSYLLREITNPELSEVLEEEIIAENEFGSNCRVEYVLFDDFLMGNESFTNEGRAKFRAGHSGWQYGGVIVLLDEDEQPYTVIVNRINRLVKLEEGEIEPLVPRTESEMIF